MDQALLDDLIDIFREESVESLDQLHRSLEAVQERGDLSAVAECLRLAHNLKGASATVGFEDFSSLAYLLEDFFLAHVERETPPDDERLASAFKALSELERLAQGGLATATEAEWRRDLGLPDDKEQRENGHGPPTTPQSAPKGARAAAALPVAAESSQAQDEALVTEAVGGKFVRVDRARLEELLRLSSDLVAQNGRLLALGGVLREVVDALGEWVPQAADEEPVLEMVVEQLSVLAEQDRHEAAQAAELASGVEDAAKRMRMTRLDSAFAGWRRVVADAGQQLGKDVRLRGELGDAEVDRHVLDRLHVPIIHLLRNAVAHGIESPGVRFEKGKPKRGEVVVGARQRGVSVELWIQDDGAGVDAQAIAEAAVEKGLLTADAAAELKAEEAIALLFRPGFSTTKSADRVSGRGVGLDEVRATLEQLGGSVSVSPVEGFPGGTRFELDFPVSVLSTRGLVVEDGGQRYVLPLHNVQRTERARARDLREVDGRRMLSTSKGSLIEFQPLQRLMAAADSGAGVLPDALEVVILKLGKEELAVCVQKVVGDAEVVIKPLPWNLAGRVRAAGVCVMRDGTLALALEPRQFARAWAKTSLPAQSKAPPKVLVVDDSLTRRTLHSNLMRSAGYGVSSAPNGARAWEMLRSERFDILVTDVQMPELDGFALTERVRSDPTLARLPVVLVTGLTDRADEQRGVAVGANAYVRKQDFAQERLLETVASLLQEAS